MAKNSPGEAVRHGNEWLPQRAGSESEILKRRAVTAPRVELHMHMHISWDFRNCARLLQTRGAHHGFCEDGNTAPPPEVGRRKGLGFRV